MKRIGFAAFCIACVMSFTLAISTRERPEIAAKRSISAGDAWVVNITIPNGQPAQEITVVLVNGLQSLKTTLVLGTGGVASWLIPQGKITQAGESVLVVYHGGDEYRQSLQVMPRSPTTLDLFTTANTLPSYGKGVAQIMVLPRDQWGNAADNSESFRLNTIYPDGNRMSKTFVYNNGLGWLTLRSSGNPGRVRLSVEQGLASAALEMLQTPAEPQTISLRVTPDCVLNDGRDRITLSATVTDSHDNAVADGTLVHFYWQALHGYARTIDGQASLRLPAPLKTGWFIYYARSGQARSNAVFLKVDGDTCADD